MYLKGDSKQYEQAIQRVFDQSVLLASQLPYYMSWCNSVTHALSILKAAEASRAEPPRPRYDEGIIARDSQKTPERVKRLFNQEGKAVTPEETARGRATRKQG